MGLKSYNIENVFTKKIKLIEYGSLTDDVRALVDYTVKESLKPNPTMRIYGGIKTIKPKKENLWFLSWSDIIELRIAIAEEKIYEVFKIVFGIKEVEFSRLELFNAFSVYKWIADQFNEIVKIEVQELAHELTEEEKEAGAEELQEFGYSLSLDAIAQGDILKYDEYLKLPYVKIFRKMCMDKKRYDINKTMQENASRKSQVNSRGV